MQNDEAIEERVVVLDCGCDLRPSCRRNGGGIEEFGEFVESVADMAGVGTRWGP
jgi:hypothetical protein